MAKLTITFIEDLVPPPSGYRFVWDDELKGFGIRLTPTRKTYVLQYRNRQGRSKRMTLGRFEHMAPAEARKHARELLGAADKGSDVAAQKRESKKAPTMSDLAERYMEQHAEVKKKASSIAADERMFRLVILPALGSRRITDIARKDIIRLHHDQKDKPIRANRVIALLSKMFNLAEQWGLRPDASNPCRHVEKFREAKRERLLSADELSRLGNTLNRIEADRSEHPSVIAAIRLLLLTGARVSEILTLKWDFIDFEQGVLRLPESKTGAKVIPLGQPALDLLRSLPRIVGNPFVCPGNRPQGHLIGLQHAWQRVRKAAALEGLRLHDLRHNYASVGAAAGLGLPIIGKILGHAKSSTTERYAHLDTSPTQAAANAIAQRIDTAMRKSPTEKVVPFKVRKASGAK
jgi:integrase